MAVIHAGGILVLPTDTSYMLAVDALNRDAVHRLYRVKKRELHQPVSVCFADQRMAAHHVVLNPLAHRIAERFLPGPLTIVVPARSRFPDALVHHGKIGFRIPNAPLTLHIVRESGTPLTATSANVSGGEEPYSVKSVMEQFDDDDLDMVLDVGPLPPQPVSTIADIEEDGITILREGPISLQELLTGPT